MEEACGVQSLTLSCAERKMTSKLRSTKVNGSPIVSETGM